MGESVAQLILPIKLEKSTERLTSLGGLMVLEELARALKLWAKVDRAVKGPRSGRGYQAHEFVQPLVWMLHAGGRRLEALRELRAEREVLERLGPEAVPEAGARLCERRVGGGRVSGRQRKSGSGDLGVRRTL